MKAWVVYNPISGGKSKDRIITCIKTELQFRFELKVIKSEYAGHAKEIAREAKEKKVPLIIAVGGDGTFHEIGTQIIHSETAMAMVPLGSGNGLARHLKIFEHYYQSILRIKKGSIQHIDVCQFDEHYFINAAGVGFDAHVAHRFAKSKRRGLKKYIVEVVKTLQTKRTVSINTQDSIIFQSFMNGSQYGNNFTTNPCGVTNDNVFEIVTLKNGSLLKLLSFVIMAFHQKANYSNLFTIKKESTYSFESDTTLAHLDGEPIVLHKKRHQIKIVPSSLKLWM